MRRRKLMWVAVVWLLFLDSRDLRAQQSETEAPEVGSTTTIVTPQATPPVLWREEEDRPRPASVPLDSSEYLPMPLPEDREGQDKAGEDVPNWLISHEISSGRTTVRESGSTPKSLLGLRRTVGSRGEGDLLPSVKEDTPLNFSGLSLVVNPEDYPWRVAVKLFMRFRDTSGTLRGYVCSGSLIDPMHVITAGHCVYSHTDSNNGWVFNDWAEEIVVVPGYDFGFEPYGNANAVQLHSWTGWTSSEDFDYDIGIIDLDRPVGSLTGWHGYGSYGSCDSFQSNSFRHAGYPRASPYTGELMYTNSGTYDSCETLLGVWYGNEVRFNNQSWGGQSGSGSYSPPASCPSCWVWAVLSNGTNTYTDDVRIDSPKFSDIGTMISEDTPGSLDLIPLDVQVSPGTIAAGQAIGPMSYFVHNYSAASWSGTVNVKVYLSTNDIISNGDILLQSHSFTYSFGAKGSTRVTVTTPPVIPAGTAQGNYWIGVILDIVDANGFNNYSDGQDAAPVSINAAPTSVVTTNPATGIGQTGATLNASVNPNGSSTTVFFDYGTTTGYGSTVNHGNIGSGTSPVNVAKPVSGLSCGTLYHFRVRATSSAGTSNGTDRTFQTSACSTAGNADTTGVFRPSNGALYLKNQNTSGFADVLLTYGLPGDYPVAGDWNGDGVNTIGVYRNGTFYLRNSNTNGFADLVVSFGAAGDQPVVGDWNGDGIDTIGIFRNGTFYLRNSNTAGTADLTFTLGSAGDVGIAGDWNGDGVTTAGVFRPSNGALYLKNSNSTGFAEIVLTYGLPGDKPVTGDWNGDGVDTIGVYRGGTFYLRNSNTNGFADLVFSLGVNGDMPIAGDWNGLP